MPDPPNDLTVPSATSTTSRAIYSMALRKLFDDLRALRLHGLSPALEHDYRGLRETLVSFLPGKPGAVASLLRSPAVAAPLRCLRDGLGERERCVAELVTQSYYQLELQGAIERAPELRAPAPIRLSPLSGTATSKPDAYTWVAGDGALTTYLATVDNNPLSHFEAHPDKEGNAIDLGGRSAQQWADALRTGLTLVETVPGLRKDVALFVRQFVPVGFNAEQHLSATYQQAIGTVYLSLHPDPLTMAEAIVHEVSHSKLNALLELDPVLQNTADERYPSPVRPDPRPIMGVLLAAHAFVAVAYLYERLAKVDHPIAQTPMFERRRSAIHQSNADGVALLAKHARPTRIGAGILEELSAAVA
ncbi:MAG: HEXXH motif-containing putative peptide modification protein [Myxococcota bacterium]